MLNKDKDYHSYSSILNFKQEGPSSLITERKKSTKGLSKGKMLDNYIYENFDDLYYVSENPIKLTSMENAFLDMVTKELEGTINEESLNSDDFKDICMELCIENGLFKSDIKTPAKIYERIDKIKDSLIDTLEAGNRIVITSEDYISVTNMNNKIKKNKYTSKFFNNTNSSDFQNLNQILIEFEYEGNKFKCYIDTIHIDHKNKTIQEIDLKFTSFKMNDFKNSYYKYRYDIQACIYTLAINQYKDDNLSISKYNVLEPCIVAVNDFEEPLLFKINNENVYGAYYGFHTDLGVYIEGIRETITKIKYHIDNKLFEYSYDYYKKGYESLGNNRKSGNGFNFIRRFTNNRNFDNLINEEVETAPGFEEYVKKYKKLSNSKEKVSYYNKKDTAKKVTKEKVIEEKSIQGLDAAFLDLLSKQSNNEIVNSAPKENDNFIQKYYEDLNNINSK